MVFWVSIKNNKFKALILAAIALAAFAFFIYWRIAGAASFNLYPGSCLGSWQNPHLAQGQPDTLIINKENSAIFSEGGIKEIYCGSFNGDLSENEIKLIKNVNLKFSWLISDEELQVPTFAEGEVGTPTASVGVATSSITIIQPLATSSEAVVQNTNDVIDQILNNIHTDEVSVIVSTTTPEITIMANDTQQTIPTPAEGGVGTPTESVGAENTAAIIDNVETESETASSTGSGQATSSPTSFWWKKYDLFFADDEVPNTGITNNELGIMNDATTTSDVDTGQAATSSLESPLAPTEDFLRVSYTLDGINWQALGTVNKNNWQDISFEIPVSQLEDIKKIQIKIESLPLLNKTPYVYLGGLALQVEYETSLISQPKTDSILLQPSNSNVGPNVSYSRMPSDPSVTNQASFNISTYRFEDFGFGDGCGLGSKSCNFWGVRAKNNNDENSIINSACVSRETLSHTFNMFLPKGDYTEIMIFAGNAQKSCEAGGELSKFLEGDSTYTIFIVN